MPEPQTLAKQCGCGQSFTVPVTTPMPQLDRKAREWMKRHAETCVEMQREIAAQGGKVYLSR